MFKRRHSLFQGPKNALSPCLGLGDVLFDSLLLVIQIVNNIIVIVKPIVVHVAVLQESWSEIQLDSFTTFQNKPKEHSPHPVLVQLHSFRREFLSRGVSGTNFFIIHFSSFVVLNAVNRKVAINLCENSNV